MQFVNNFIPRAGGGGGGRGEAGGAGGSEIPTSLTWGPGCTRH